MAVAFPKILLVVPLLVGGMYLPAVGHVAARSTGELGMVHEGFSTKQVTVDCGKTLTMVNDSHWVHIIGPGRGGTFLPAAPAGVPVTTRRLMETNAVFTTGAWNKPGTYYLTCSVHPEMTVKVVVTGGCCCPRGT